VGEEGSSVHRRFNGCSATARRSALRPPLGRMRRRARAIAPQGTMPCDTGE
jgi:hypothetical protein